MVYSIFLLASCFSLLIKSINLRRRVNAIYLLHYIMYFFVLAFCTSVSIRLQSSMSIILILYVNYFSTKITLHLYIYMRLRWQIFDFHIKFIAHLSKLIPALHIIIFIPSVPSHLCILSRY